MRPYYSHTSSHLHKFPYYKPQTRGIYIYAYIIYAYISLPKYFIFHNAGCPGGPEELIDKIRKARGCVPSPLPKYDYK